MIRKPTSGDSEQREHEAERARRSSRIGPGDSSHTDASPMHGSAKGESAHGALPRHGIEDDQGD